MLAIVWPFERFVNPISFLAITLPGTAKRLVCLRFSRKSATIPGAEHADLGAFLKDDKKGY